MKSILYLDIYDVFFKVNSLCFDVITKLENDFYVYQVKEHDFHDKTVITINVMNKKVTAQSKDIAFSDGPVVRMCHKSKNAEIFCDRLERLHELTYLYILSILGKKLDLRGIHRIHASGVSFKSNEATLFTGDSGIGKSHLAYFLNAETLSDDTIFLDCFGNVYPLLTRRGFSDKRNEKIVSEQMYKLERLKYGNKFLIPIRHKTRYDIYKLSEIYLLKSDKNVSKEKANLLNRLDYFIKYELIGLGTPQILEFFWEPGLYDFYIKTKIFFLRLKLFIYLTLFHKVTLLKTNRSDEVIQLFDDSKK